jgi:hypothetical protein
VVAEAPAATAARVRWRASTVGARHRMLMLPRRFGPPRFTRTACLTGGDLRGADPSREDLFRVNLTGATVREDLSGTHARREPDLGEPDRREPQPSEPQPGARRTQAQRGLSGADLLPEGGNAPRRAPGVAGRPAAPCRGRCAQRGSPPGCLARPHRPRRWGLAGGLAGPRPHRGSGGAFVPQLDGSAGTEPVLPRSVSPAASEGTDHRFSAGVNSLRRLRVAGLERAGHCRRARGAAPCFETRPSPFVQTISGLRYILHRYLCHAEGYPSAPGDTSLGNAPKTGAS